VFEFEGLNDTQIDMLINQRVNTRGAAIAMIVHGVRKNILTLDEALLQINNIAVSLMGEE